MARQTRRRRDSKSKNRYRPRLSSASGRATSEQSEVMPRKVEKVDWTTVFILLAIFLFSLYIRTAWTLEPATEDGYQLTGGSGNDVFQIVTGYGSDLITDFASGQDSLKISGIVFFSLGSFMSNKL